MFTLLRWTGSISFGLIALAGFVPMSRAQGPPATRRAVRSNRAKKGPSCTQMGPFSHALNRGKHSEYWVKAG
jgi:hypothetical protein